jgi:hypothetical protein
MFNLTIKQISVVFPLILATLTFAFIAIRHMLGLESGTGGHWPTAFVSIVVSLVLCWITYTLIQRFESDNMYSLNTDY